MLWTDQDFITAADLATIDNDVVATAAAQLIDLPTSIRRGIEDAGRYLEANMISFSTYVSSQDLSSNHFNAVHYTGTQPNARRRFSLEQVVTTGRNANYWSELKLWAVNRVLMVFYLTASNKAEDDRYEAKYDMYKLRDEREMWPLFKRTGLPVVTRPMPRPMAAQARDAGVWTASLASAPGNVATGDVDVAITFLDASLYLSEARTNNGQSDLSDRQTLTLTADQGISIDATALTFPDGVLPPDQMARGFVVPLTATGWNVWVGPKGGVLRLQNATPISVGTKTYALPGDPALASGSVAGLGQYAESFYTIPDLFFRG